MEEENPASDSAKEQHTVQTEFKKPAVLVGRVGKLPKKVKNVPESGVVCAEEKTSENKSESSFNNKYSSQSTVLLKKTSTPIPYKEPKWSGLCPDGSNYALEVLKSGIIIEKIDLTNKPYCVFGRLSDCDVMLANPTVSRHHAVLQYKAFSDEGEPPAGWYIYDLGSTHGTHLNKERVKTAHYTRVRVGHHIGFGNSSRSFIMLGPDFDCEGESELSATEIQKRALEMKLDREKMLQAAMEQREKQRAEEERKKKEEGIDWGMGEDAEEESDLTENPFAATANEELYLTDPKKTLRGYFEREGHELNYDCEERGVGQFVCRVELPMDDARGRPVVAEVIHRGKKKEAVVACALEACRILDRAGLLRQAKHESRRRKQRDWSADDYYDSDEDTFLDRTGSVERKRKFRMQKHGAKEVEQEKPLTYNDLLKQITEIETAISVEQKTLEQLHAPTRTQDNNEADSLDSFMNSLQHGVVDTSRVSNVKINIQRLKSELIKTQRLADVARPAHVPPLVKKDDKKMPVKISNSVVYGKRIQLKDSAKRTKHTPETIQEETEFVEEIDTDEEVEQSTSPKEDSMTNMKQKGVESDNGDQKSLEDDKDQTYIEKKNTDQKTSFGDKPERTMDTSVVPINSGQEVEDSKNEKMEETDTDDNSCEVKKMIGPMRPPDDYVVPDKYFDHETARDLPEDFEESEYL